MEYQLGACAYGWYEGPRYGRATDAAAASEHAVAQAFAAGMGGGRLPDFWRPIDAEVYAVLAYLRKVVSEVDESGAEPSVAELKTRRVLIATDCLPALQQIEKAWRLGNVDGLRRWDRGAMLEAITHLRRQLGTVVLMWVPAHRGCSPNAYADAVAKASLGAPEREPVARTLSELVHGRPCLYEVRTRTGEHERWVTS